MEPIDLAQAAIENDIDATFNCLIEEWNNLPEIAEDEERCLLRNMSAECTMTNYKVIEETNHINETLQKHSSDVTARILNAKIIIDNNDSDFIRDCEEIERLIMNITTHPEGGSIAVKLRNDLIETRSDFVHKRYRRDREVFSKDVSTWKSVPMFKLEDYEPGLDTSFTINDVEDSNVIKTRSRSQYNINLWSNGGDELRKRKKLDQDVEKQRKK
jgi:hypothetical protein